MITHPNPRNDRYRERNIKQWKLPLAQLLPAPSPLGVLGRAVPRRANLSAAPGVRAALPRDVHPAVTVPIQLLLPVLVTFVAPAVRAVRVVPLAAGPPFEKAPGGAHLFDPIGRVAVLLFARIVRKATQLRPRLHLKRARLLPLHPVRLPSVHLIVLPPADRRARDTVHDLVPVNPVTGLAEDQGAGREDVLVLDPQAHGPTECPHQGVTPMKYLPPA